MRLLIFTLAVCAFAVAMFGHSPPAAAADEEKLDPKIPPPDKKKYKAVRDAKDWENPYLIVRADGIEVVAKALPKGRKVVPTAMLRATFAALPRDAWPYGRVVAVQEVGIRSGGDEMPITRNKEAMNEVLKALGITSELWPSS